MKIKKSVLTTLVVSAFAVAGSQASVTIATYNMGDALGTPTVSNGFTGASDFTTTRGPMTTSSIAGSSGPNGTAAVTTSNWTDPGGVWTITLNLTGWTDVSIGNWSQQASNTGPRDYQVFVSYNGGVDFTSIGSVYAIINGNSSQSGFALGAAADNNDAVVVEWRNVSTFSVRGNEDDIGTTGTSRFGNFEVTAIPEPTTALLGGLGLLALLRRRR